jgi:hypothetical protein
MDEGNLVVVAQARKCSLARARELFPNENIGELLLSAPAPSNPSAARRMRASPPRPSDYDDDWDDPHDYPENFWES